MATANKKIISNLNEIARHKGRLGIETTSEYLKIALAEYSSGKEEISFLDNIYIKDIPEAKVLDLLTAMVKPIRGRIGDVFLILPVSASITKSIQIPSTDDAEIRDILNLQAGRQTPYAREELVIDYIRLGEYQGVYTKVLVVMATNEIARRNLRLLSQAGLKVSKILFSAEGAGVYSAILMKPGAGTTKAFLEIDMESSNFNIFGERGLLFTRNMSFGRRQLSADKDKTIKRFSDEAKKSIEAYQAEDIAKNPNLIYVTGENEQLLEAGRNIARELNIEVKSFPFRENVHVQSPFDKNIVSIDSPSYESLICTIATSDKQTVDLIPDDIKLQRKYEQKTRKFITAGILFMVMFFQICLMLITRMYYKEKTLTELRQKFNEKINMADSLRNVSEKTRMIRGFLAPKYSIADVLTRLYDILPEEIYLKAITIDKEGKVYIKGTSKSMSRIFSFVTELESDPIFESVKTESTESKKEGGEDVSDFAIVMVVERKDRQAADAPKKENPEKPAGQAGAGADKDDKGLEKIST